MTIDLIPYGKTCGRVHGSPGRESRPNSITIDSHCHLHINKAEETVSGLVDIQDIPLLRWVSDHTRKVNQKQMKDRFIEITDIESRFNIMEEQGIDFQIISPTPNQAYYWVEGEKGFDAIRQVNDGISEAVNKYPKKFSGMCTIPLQNIDEALKELERCKNNLGYKAIQILTCIHGKEVSDPYFKTFWSEVEKEQMTVFLHPNGFPQGERFTNHYFSNVICNPFETAVAIQRLIFDGILEKHPNLKIYCAHGGGYLPSYHARMDHAWGARSDCREIINNPPSYYLSKLFFDTVVFSYEQLIYLVKLYGYQNIIMGTDYPFDMADSDPVGHVMNCPEINDLAKKAIVGGNALKLFDLDITM